jgi:hypothetical protein
MYPSKSLQIRHWQQKHAPLSAHAMHSNEQFKEIDYTYEHHHAP